MFNKGLRQCDHQTYIELRDCDHSSDLDLRQCDHNDKKEWSPD